MRVQAQRIGNEKTLLGDNCIPVGDSILYIPLRKDGEMNKEMDEGIKTGLLIGVVVELMWIVWLLKEILAK